MQPAKEDMADPGELSFARKENDTLLVRLKARWGILSEGGKKVLANKQSVLNMPIQGNTIDEMVSAQSRLVARLSHDIAEEIKRLEEQGGGQWISDFRIWILEFGF